MYNGQPASSRLGAGISIGNIPENACVYTGKNTVTPVADGEYNATLKIGAVSYRKVRLRVTKPQSVCASGSLIGLRIYNNGLIVLGTQRIETAEGTASPHRRSSFRGRNMSLCQRLQCCRAPMRRCTVRRSCHAPG